MTARILGQAGRPAASSSTNTPAMRPIAAFGARLSLEEAVDLALGRVGSA
jgi:hypothetical protein